jgi:hypothetical protein
VKNAVHVEVEQSSPDLLKFLEKVVSDSGLTQENFGRGQVLSYFGYKCLLHEPAKVVDGSAKLGARHGTVVFAGAPKQLKNAWIKKRSRISAI